MKKFTILVDCDDVLINFVDCWVNALNHKYGTNVRSEDITDWEIAQFFPGLTRWQVFSVLAQPSMYDDIAPMTGAKAAIRYLINTGRKIRVVTATSYDILKPKMEKLLSLYPYLSWDDVVVANDKSAVIGDVIIDDNTKNLETSPCRIKILFDRPHNRSYKITPESRIIRCKSWDEICEFLDTIQFLIERGGCFE